MPTGYTADVMNGKITDFTKFAMQCARGFGALITMRDDPWDAPVPEKFEPHDYNLKRLEEAKERLRQLQTMSPEAMEAECAAEYEKRMGDRERYKAEQRAENDRLDAMQAHVLAWEPPSANHTEMKSFMLDQIRMSRNSIDTLDKYDPIEKLSPKDWYNKQIESAHRDIGYNAAEYAKEVERAEGRTLWVKQLRDSLAIPASSEDVPSQDHGTAPLKFVNSIRPVRPQISHRS